MIKTSPSAETDNSIAGPPRIYLDNAATSWPKPIEVIDAIKRFYRDSGTPAFRGLSGQSSGTDLAVERCRKKLADFLGAHDKNEVVFAFNGTDALNMVLQGVLRPSDHVVTTTLEHNSVLRPLNFLAVEKSVRVTFVDMDSSGIVDPDKIIAAVRPETRLVCLSHVSNVTGVAQPVDVVGERLRNHKAMLLVDAAQSLGHIDVKVEQINCDFLAAPGHKGLYGPLGTGLLYAAQRAWPAIKPIRFGGTGTHSDSSVQPDEMPTRLESGNLNVGGILGLEAGLDFVFTKTISAIHKWSSRLVEHALKRLTVIPNVQVYCSDAAKNSSVFSFNIVDQDPREVALILEGSFGIQTRAGFHCAPRVHTSLETFDRGGTIRVSVGWFNTLDEIDILVEAVSEIAKM